MVGVSHGRELEGHVRGHLKSSMGTRLSACVETNVAKMAERIVPCAQVGPVTPPDCCPRESLMGAAIRGLQWVGQPRGCLDCASFHLAGCLYKSFLFF